MIDKDSNIPEKTQIALLKMGYRKLKNDKLTAYVKPIGYSLFYVREDSNLLCQYFRGATNREFLCMKTWELNEKEALEIIKSAEHFHHRVYCKSEFEFLTPEQEIEIAMTAAPKKVKPKQREEVEMTPEVKKIIERGFILESEAEEVMNGESARMIKVGLYDRQNNCEGIWAVVIDGLEKYEDNDSFDEEITVVLANHALAFMPARSWGLVLKANTKLDERPRIYMRDVEEEVEKIYEAYNNEWERVLNERGTKESS